MMSGRALALLILITTSCAAEQKIGSGQPPPDEWSGKVDGPEGDGKLPMEVVEEHMGPVRSKIQACADATTYEGKVSARIRIEPSGSASAVLAASSGESAIDQCITSAFQDASFPRSKRGQQFRYSFSF